MRRSRPGVGLPWFCRLASQAWAHQASAVRGSQRSRKRWSWLGTARVGQGARSWATLCTVVLRGAASCCPVLVAWERLVCRPLRPGSGVPGLPGWSLLHRLLRVRGPCGGLGDLSAYPVEGAAAGSGVAHQAMAPSAVGALPFSLGLASPGGKRVLVEQGALRLPLSASIRRCAGPGHRGAALLGSLPPPHASPVSRARETRRLSHRSPPGGPWLLWILGFAKDRLTRAACRDVGILGV